MTAIATSRNLSMDTAGLIGRGSGAGRSTIMDAATVRAFADAVNKAGDTMTGALVVENSIKSCRDVGFLVGSFAGPGTSVLTFFETANIWLYDGVGSCRLATNGTQTRLNSDTVFGFSSGSPDGAAIDTPIVRAAAGITEFRNGTTAQAIRISKTFTSTTSFECAEIGYNATAAAYFIGSRIGSAGGSAQALKIGHLAADGTTFTGLTVATNGTLLTPSGSQTTLGVGIGAVNTGFYNNSPGQLRVVLSGTISIGFLAAGLETVGYLGLTGSSPGSGSSDARFYRNAAGQTDVRGDSGFRIRNLANSADAALTCSTITASGNLLLQNSTTAVLAEFSKTYTSSTNREYLNVGFTGTNYDFVSRVGSAGGSNQPIRIGHLAANGTTFTGLTVATDGGITTAELTTFAITTNSYWDGPTGRTLNIRSKTGILILHDGNQNFVMTSTALNLGATSGRDLIGVRSIAAVQTVATTGSPTLFTLTGAAHTTLTASTEASDVDFNFARTVQFATGAITTQRAVKISAPTYAFVSASTITTASTVSISGAPVAGANATITNAYALNVVTGTANFGGQLIQKPPASVTLGTNGQFAIEMTSDTAGNLVYRGSDGTTRRFAFTVS